MKKTLLIMALAGLGLTSMAQTEQGRIMVGAGINFGANVDEDMDPDDGRIVKRVTTNTMDFNVRGGYFLSDNFMLGLVFGMNNGTEKTENIGAVNTTIATKKNNGMSVGPFVRMYKMLGSSRFALFGQGALTYGTGKSSTLDESTAPSYTPTETTGSNNVTSVRIHPGISYFITNTIAFETYFGNVGLDLSSSEDNNKDGKQVSNTKSTNLNTKLNLNLSSIWVSLNFYFGGGGGGGGSTAPANP